MEYTWIKLPVETMTIYFPQFMKITYCIKKLQSVDAIDK